MLALAALLASALVGPAAPPLSPTADNDAIYAEIAAGDPTLTDSPTPLERLLAATELAEARLQATTDPDDASDLLTLMVGGRKAAHLRTGDTLHLCRLIAAAEHALTIAGAPLPLTAAATDFKEEARASLGAKSCEGERTEKADSPPPSGNRANGATGPTGPSELPAARPVIPAPIDRAGRRRTAAGLGTLVPGLLLFAPVAGLLAHRAAGERELAEIRVDSKDRPRTPQEIAESAALGRRYTAMTAGAIVLGVTGAALAVTGAALLATGARQRRMAVAPWGARGVGGLVLQGTF